MTPRQLCPQQASYHHRIKSSYLAGPGVWHSLESSQCLCPEACQDISPKTLSPPGPPTHLRPTFLSLSSIDSWRLSVESPCENSPQTRGVGSHLTKDMAMPLLFLRTALIQWLFQGKKGPEWGPPLKGHPNPHCYHRICWGLCWDYQSNAIAKYICTDNAVTHNVYHMSPWWGKENHSKMFSHITENSTPRKTKIYKMVEIAPDWNKKNTCYDNCTTGLKLTRLKEGQQFRGFYNELFREDIWNDNTNYIIRNLEV